MNIESIIAILANIVTILMAAKTDMPIFSLLKKAFFDIFWHTEFHWEVRTLYFSGIDNKMGFEPLTFLFEFK